eukprot:6191601-Heterocapsa_arctica.AAC.1
MARHYRKCGCMKPHSSGQGSRQTHSPKGRTHRAREYVRTCHHLGRENTASRKVHARVANRENWDP